MDTFGTWTGEMKGTWNVTLKFKFKLRPEECGVEALSGRKAKAKKLRKSYGVHMACNARKSQRPPPY